MSIISINNLSFGYDRSESLIFNNISLNLDSSWKAGLIGRNGRGKTTLLKLLANELEYSGRIISKCDFFRFPYAVENKDDLAINIIKQICFKDDWEIIREAGYIELDEDVLYRIFSSLSMGEQTKCLLAAVFLLENVFLLLDEPTNHLDLKSRKVVAKYLKNKSGFIIVSHNRYLLNEVCDHIISVNKKGIDIISGNYDVWRDSFEKREQFENCQNERIKKDIKRLEAASKKSAAWSNQAEKSKFGKGSVDRGFIGHKAAKMMKHSKTYQKRIERELGEKENLLNNAENSFLLKLTPMKYRSNKLGYVNHLGLSYFGERIFQDISFDICRGERIALTGNNGSGKSSLIKILLNELKATSGEFHINSDVKISYVPQSIENMSGTLFSWSQDNNIDYNLFLAILNKLDIESSCFHSRIELFSLGQKKKVQLAKSLCENAHLYIWDEPLNYIDIISRGQMEDMLLSHTPTMIFVEHDETFLNRIATKIIEL